MGAPYDAGEQGRLRELSEEPLVMAAEDHHVHVVLFRRGADAFDGVADVRNERRRSRTRLFRPLGDFRFRRASGRLSTPGPVT